jgi:ABC-type protease/lipase transport system fused ATPase/permease subunit
MHQDQAAIAALVVFWRRRSRRQIALVSQDTILFNHTISANIALAAEDVDAAAIAAAPVLAAIPSTPCSRRARSSASGNLDHGI